MKINEDKKEYASLVVEKLKEINCKHKFVVGVEKKYIAQTGGGSHIAEIPFLYCEKCGKVKKIIRE